MKLADPIWAESIYAGATRKASWIVGWWLYPIRISATRTLLVWQTSDNFPNYGTNFSMGIRSDGKIQLMEAIGSNVNANPLTFDPQDASGTVVLTSKAALPINTMAPTSGSLAGWSHVSLVLQLKGTGNGSARLFVNGCADSSVTGGNWIPANLLTMMWHNPSGSDELCRSQLVICDDSGSDNNTNVSQFARVATVFPTSDVLTQWSAGYSAVNSNPGPPGSPGAGLSTLSSPDDLFGFPAPSLQREILGVVMNMSIKAASSQTFAGLAKSGGSAFASPTLSSLLSGYWTRQGVMEREPLSSLPWTPATIAAAAFGMRGIAGTGELVNQYFLEVLSQSGRARCGAQSYGF